MKRNPLVQTRSSSLTLLVVEASACVTLLAISVAPTSSRAAETISPDAAAKPVALEMGAHYTLWKIPSGGAYTELASGLNHWTGTSWARSQETISIVNGYGLATNGAHQAVFPPSVDEGVDYWDPSGNHFQTAVIGLAFYDYASGKSTMLCEVKRSIPGTVDSNTVVYPDVFSDGISGSIRFTYKKGSFEQEILILAQLPSPSLFSLSPNSTRLQCWTELLDAPEPIVKKTTYIYQESDPTVRQAYAEPDFKDEFLEWNNFHISRGKAFAIDSEAIRQAGINVEQEVPVGKEWIAATDPASGQIRRFLVESVELSAVQPLLDTLPTAAIDRPGVTNPGRARPMLAKTKPVLPHAQFLASIPKVAHATPSPLNGPSPRRSGIDGASDRGFGPGGGERAGVRGVNVPIRNGQQLQMAKSAAANPKRGVSLDYSTLLTATNVTLKSTMTYDVTSAITLAGTNVAEGGCVIKYARNAGQISVGGSGAILKFTGGSYRPVIATAEDDQWYGETIPDTSPSANGYYAPYAFFFDASSSGVLSSINNARILYAINGVGYTGSASGDGHLVRNSQFRSCSNVVNVGYASPVIFRNVLAANLVNFVQNWAGNVRGENLTISSATSLTNSAGATTLYLTNTLLYSVSNSGYTGGASNAIASSNPFQSASRGSYYLASGSSYRNAGTTGIDANLAADLRQRTTYPPLIISSTITNDTILSPQAQRDTDAPDLGWHYDPLDWILSGGVAITNATLTLTDTVAVAVYGSVGLKMRTGSKLSSSGSTPTNLIRLCHVQSVQEQNDSGSPTTTLFADDLVSGTQPEARLRFTELSLLANGGAQHSSGGKMGLLAATDCRFLAGGLNWSTNGDNTRALTLTNSLFERVTNTFDTSADAFTLHARNNLFWNSGLKLSPTNSNNWTWYDNVFDSDVVTTNSNTFTNDYNGYLNVSEFASHGTHDVVTNLAWQAGALGVYYQSTNSPFLNKGSRNATNAGLYHFCVTTNNWKETNSVVDIGLHYVAVDANGNPIDTDSDGLPDWLEDLNGNGSVDSGESDWTLADTDHDGVSDYVEILQGRNPLVAGSIADTNNLINLRVYTPLK